MARIIFSTEHLLDATRTLVATRGARATTVAAVAAEAGAPVGSIYHRYASIDDLLASVWVRAVNRTHSVHDQVPVAAASPVDAAVALAEAVLDFCVAHADDVRLLDRLGRDDIASLTVSEPVRMQIDAADRRGRVLIEAAAQVLLGAATPAAVDTAILMFVDLPRSVAQRYLAYPDRLPQQRREHLALAVRAIHEAAIGSVVLTST